MLTRGQPRWRLQPPPESVSNARVPSSKIPILVKAAGNIPLGSLAVAGYWRCPIRKKLLPYYTEVALTQCSYLFVEKQTNRVSNFVSPCNARLYEFRAQRVLLRRGLRSGSFRQRYTLATRRLNARRRELDRRAFFVSVQSFVAFLRFAFRRCRTFWKNAFENSALLVELMVHREFL
jgi:hypothetical protein